MTQSLKKIALSLVIATSVTAVSFAKGNKIGDNELEGSVNFQNSTSFDASIIFEKPEIKKLEDSFNLEKIAQSRVFLPDDQDDMDLFSNSRPEVELLVEELSSLKEDKLFKLSQEEKAKMKEQERARQREIEERQQEERLAKDNAEAAELYVKFMQELEEKRAAAAAPSTLQVIGSYAYSTGEIFLSGLDYAARSLPGAFLATYLSIELLEEAAAYTGYATAAGFTTWYSGGNVAAGKVAGNTAYYGIKSGITVARTLLPSFEYATAAFFARDTKAVINGVLDAAPEVLNKGASLTASVASYIRSFWA